MMIKMMIKNIPGESFGIPAPFASGFRVFFIVLAIVLLAGCPMDPSPGQQNTEQENTEPPPESKNFNVQRVDNNVYEDVTALKLAEGNKCIVFVADDGQISAATARAIAAEYDTNIYSKIAGVFGDYTTTDYDVDGNGKIILLLVDIKDGYNGSGGYVAGYFDSYHMYDLLSSNRADMLFIDINPQVPGSPGFYANIAHELQHLTNFAMHNGRSQELWLDEGLSSSAEYLYGGHQQDRIDYFNYDPKGTIIQGNNFFVWNGTWEGQPDGDSLANYATVYLFFQWLRIHTGGTQVYWDISNSDVRDYRAVTQAVTNRIPGITETEAPKVWDQLLSSWMIANLVSDPDGLYGYKNEITTGVRGFKHNNPHKTQFSPGEGIYSVLKDKSLIDNDVVGDGPNIKYLGIGRSTQGELVIVNAQPYRGQVLLTYNANPLPSGDAEAGFILSYFPSPSVSTFFPGAARSALPSGELPSSYPIGAHDLRARNSPGETGLRAVR
jgi:hypothetical protein